MLSVIGTPGWWLLETVQFVLMLIGALGVFGRGRSRDLLVVVGYSLAIGVTAVQWWLFGAMGFVLSVVVAFIVLRYVSNTAVLMLLGKMGVVHPDIQIAFDMHRAEQERQKHLERLMHGGVEEMLHGKGLNDCPKVSMLHLPGSTAAKQLGLTDEDIDRLLMIISQTAGPLRPQTFAKILNRKPVVRAYLDWRAPSDGKNKDGRMMKLQHAILFQ